MFTLSFKKSNSKNYNEVKKLASYFNDNSFENDRHTVVIGLKEIFEKWDYFNLLFWRTVDWKQSFFGYDEFNVYSHSEKTRIFYALQQAKSDWLCMSEVYISNLSLAALGIEELEILRAKAFNGVDTDRMLDYLVAVKQRLRYKEEFGHLNFETPLRNSDCIGRRSRREKNKEKENGREG